MTGPNESPCPREALQAWLWVGELHLRLGQVSWAQSWFESLATLFPTMAPAWMGLGVASDRLGALELARRAYTEAAHLSPHWASARLNLVEVVLAQAATAAERDRVRLEQLAASQCALAARSGETTNPADQARLRLLLQHLGAPPQKAVPPLEVFRSGASPRLSTSSRIGGPAKGGASPVSAEIPARPPQGRSRRKGAPLPRRGGPGAAARTTGLSDGAQRVAPFRGSGE